MSDMTLDIIADEFNFDDGQFFEEENEIERMIETHDDINRKAE